MLLSLSDFDLDAVRSAARPVVTITNTNVYSMTRRPASNVGDISSPVLWPSRCVSGYCRSRFPNHGAEWRAGVREHVPW